MTCRPSVVSSLAWAGGLLLWLAPAPASALSALYLRRVLDLSIEAPSATRPRDDVGATIRVGQRTILAEFRSAAADGPVFVSGATAVLFLVSGKTGMENCAVVAVEIARRTQTGTRLVAGSGAVATSILPRRASAGPIEVDVPLQGVLAEPGERLELVIAVENRCTSQRSPALLYDGLDAPSALAFEEAPPPSSTTTTTTTSTSTAAPPTTTTTTTLPRQAGCLFEPLSGYEAVFCRLDAISQVLADEDPAELGGPAVHARLQRRLLRTRDLVVVAQSGRRVRRLLRRAVVTLGAFDRLVRRRARRGGVDPDLSEELSGLVGGAAAEIGDLRRR